MATKLAITLFNILLWICFGVYALGGVTVFDKTYLSYIGDFSRICAIFYLILRITTSFRFRDTSFSSALQKMIQAIIECFQSCSIAPFKKLPASSWALLLCSLYSLVAFLMIPLLRHWNFGTHIYDLGIFENALYHFKTNGNFLTTFYTNSAGEFVHFVPNNRLSLWMFPLGVLFKFIPKIEVLLLLQSAIIVASLVPLYKLSKLILPQSIPPWISLLLFFFYQANTSLIFWDFHEAPFITFFALWAFYFIEKRNLKMAFLHLFLMAFWREDAWLTFSAISFYLLFRIKNKILPLSMSLLGIGVFLFHVKFLNEVNTVSNRYPTLGNHLGEVFHHLMTQPWIIFQILSAPLNLAFLVQLILRTGGGIFLFSGWALIPVIPVLAEISLAQFPGMLNWQYHYAAQMTGPIFFATFYAIAKWYPIIQNKFSIQTAQRCLGIFIAIWLMQLQTSLPSSFKKLMHANQDAPCLNEFINLIPKDAPIVVNGRLSAQLTQRPWIVLPYTQIDKSQAHYWVGDFQPILGQEEYDQLIHDPQWQLIKSECGSFLFQNKNSQ